jgi:hypothetical protein
MMGFSLAFFRQLWSNLKRLRNRERIYIIPTWYCILFNTILASSVAYGFFGHNILVVSASILIVFIELLSMIEAHVNVRDIKLDVERMPAMEAGAAGIMDLQISSSSQSFGICFYTLPCAAPSKVGGRQFIAAKSTQQRMALRFLRGELFQAWWSWRQGPEETRVAADGRSALVGDWLLPSEQKGAEVSINPQQRVVSVTIHPVNRGVYPTPDVVCVSMFPFGFFRAVRRYGLGGQVVVYPRQRGVSFRDQITSDGLRYPNVQTGLRSAHGTADVSSRAFAKNTSSDYREHRAFTAGDSLGRIDWKVSSRRRQTMVKVFEGSPMSRQRLLRWSDTAALEVESKLEQLSLWIHETAEDLIPFAVELPGLVTPMGVGETHKHHCLRLLAAFDGDGFKPEEAA